MRSTVSGLGAGAYLVGERCTPSPVHASGAIHYVAEGQGAYGLLVDGT